MFLLIGSCHILFSCLGHASGKAGNFLNWDKNLDGFIRRDEVSEPECAV